MQCGDPPVKPAIRYVRQVGVANRLHTEACVKKAIEGHPIETTNVRDAMQLYLTFDRMQREMAVSGSFGFFQKRTGLTARECVVIDRTLAR